MTGNSTPAQGGVTDDPIRIGTMLYTLVEPHRGHEVAYNRWYERDHFYAGCQIGAYNFAGGRFVATAPLKELRYPTGDGALVADPAVGSYLGVYYVLDGHHDEWNRWAVDQVNALHAAGRMFEERDHIHTGLYHFEWEQGRDADGVPAELTLDHRFAGMVSVHLEPAAGTTGAELSAWVRDRYLPGGWRVRRSPWCWGSARSHSWPTPRVTCPGTTRWTTVSCCSPSSTRTRRRASPTCSARSTGRSTMPASARCCGRRPSSARCRAPTRTRTSSGRTASPTGRRYRTPPTAPKRPTE